MWSKESWTACRGKSSAYIVWHDEEGLRGARKSKRKRILSLARGNLKKTLLIRFSTNQRDRTRQILVVVRKPLIGSWLCKKVQKFGRRWSYTECWNKVHRFLELWQTSNPHNFWTAGPTEPRFRLWAFQGQAFQMLHIPPRSLHGKNKRRENDLKAVAIDNTLTQ